VGPESNIHLRELARHSATARKYGNTEYGY